jgi:hypothetical protein
MSELDERSQAAAEAIARGEISVPLRCHHCRTPSVIVDNDTSAVLPAETKGLLCLQCGRRTNLRMAHRMRQQEMQMIIAAGVDPRPHHRGA